MSVLLYIPWFKAEPLPIPIPGLDWELPIQPFGVLVAIGVLLGAKMAEWHAKREGIAPGAVADLITHVVLSGFVLGYFLNGLFYHPDTMAEVMRDPSLLFTRWLGLSSYGGFIGAILGAWLWRWRRKAPLFPVLDSVAFGFPFGWLFGRLGCFVVHDHPGKVTDFFLAVDDYRVGLPPFEPRHDLGLYEVFWSLGCILVFAVLLRRPRPRGLYLALLPLLYTPIRFFLDYLRAPPAEGGDMRYLGFTPGQYASAALLIVGLLVLKRVIDRPDREVPDILKWPPPEDEPPDDEAEDAPAEAGDGDGTSPDPDHGHVSRPRP